MEHALPSSQPTPTPNVDDPTPLVPPTEPAPQPFVLNPQWLLWGILLATVALFWPTLRYEFVNWDDSYFISNNPLVTHKLSWESVKAIFSTPVLRGYAPLTVLSFAIEYNLVGNSPTLYHFDNLVLHLLNVWLVWRIFSKLGLNPYSAGFVTLLFAVHPMHVESVAWASERKDVLFGLFFLAATDRYLAWHQSGRTATRSLYLMYGFFALSLFSKIQSVALPASLIVLDYYLQRPLRWNLVLEKLPLFLLSLLIGSIGFYFLHSEPKAAGEPIYSLFERLGIGGYGLTVYFMKLILPYEMVTLYPFPRVGQLPVIFYVSIASFFVFFYGVWLAYKANLRTVVTGLMYFMVNIAFVLQVLDGGQGFKADHYTYIPYLGLFLILAWLAERFVAGGQASRVYAVVGVWLLLLGYLSYKQVRVWQNGYTLWSNVIKSYPDSDRLYRSRANYLLSKGYPKEALQDYSTSIGLGTTDPRTYFSRGVLYAQYRKYPRAFADMTKALKLLPNFPLYLTSRAEYAFKGNLLPRQAIVNDLTRSIALDPKQPNAYRYRYLIFYNAGDGARALSDADAYLRLNPREPTMYLARAMALE
ncbi:MAG: hypothetical protein H7Y12_01625, partial [Sphingobacteriaceae bacterium]|nr:hypothetical protein [Cytophagaceae bacterium]